MTRSPLARLGALALAAVWLASPLLGPASIEAQNGPGETLFRKNCAVCHGVQGKGDGEIARNLDPKPRNLQNARVMLHYTEDMLLARIRDGVPGTAMPPWKNVLTETEIAEVFAYVKSAFIEAPANRGDLPPFSDRRPPERFSAEKLAKVAREMPKEVATQEPVWVKAGAEAFLKNCSGCHGRQGNGKGMLYQYHDPRPRNLMNKAYMNNLKDEQLFFSIQNGVHGTAMPNWGEALPSRIRWEIVAFLRSKTRPVAVKAENTGH